MPEEESDVAVELAMKTNPDGSVLPMKAPAKQCCTGTEIGPMPRVALLFQAQREMTG